jgi:hypothetical protein
MAAAPYSVSSQRSGSSTTTVTPIHCRHTPGGVVNTDTFVGCDVTDDELTRSDKLAKGRVAKRRIKYRKAQELGVTTTGAVVQAEKDARAAAKGFASRQEARQAESDARAAAKGFASRQEAQLAEKNARAAAKGFASRQEAELAEKNVQAARQLGPKATRSDLSKIQRGERALAQQEGVPVGKIRSRRLQANPAASPPSVDPSMTRTTVALANREEASTRSWNIGDRFTIPLQNGQTRLFEVRRNRHGGEPIYQKDFQEISRGG